MAAVEFSQKALEKHSSPEQLDRLMRVTSPRRWLALAAFAIFLGAVVAWMLLATLPTTVSGNAILVRKGGIHRVSAPVSGILRDVLVRYGESVPAGKVVAHLTDPSATDSEPLEIKAREAGVLVKKLAREGEFVSAGATLLVFQPDDPTLEVIAYLPLTQAKSIRPGMSVQVSPTTVPREEYGFLLGTVRRVSEFPSEDNNMLDTLGNDELVKYFLNGGSSFQVVPLEIRVDLVPDPSTASGYAWSSHEGPPIKLSPETLATAAFVLGRERPITLFTAGSAP